MIIQIMIIIIKTTLSTTTLQGKYVHIIFLNDQLMMASVFSSLSVHVFEQYSKASLSSQISNYQLCKMVQLDVRKPCDNPHMSALR